MPEGGEILPGLQAASEPVETVEDTSHDETVDSEPAEDDGPANESARDTVKRLYEKAQAESDGDESGDEEALDPTVKRKEKPQKLQKGQKQDFAIPAPARLTAEQKEAFNGLPTPLKRAAHQMFKDHEAKFTQANQQLQSELRETQGIREAVRPYLLAHPELAQEGYTESRFVASLVAAHQRLTDPKTAKQTWLELGRSVGVSDDVIRALSSHAGAKQGAQSDISEHPQFKALQQELAQVKSYVDGAQKQHFDANVNQIVSEMEAVRDERDASGRYLYPELHDEAFLSQAKPLVSALVGAMPNLSYGEALKRAYYTLTGNSPRQSQTRFPTQNNQMARAQQAAVSVRGRSAPAASGDSGELPPEALGNARDSVRWALNQLRRGI